MDNYNIMSWSFLTLLFFCIVTGHDLNIQLEGELKVAEAATEDMKLLVLSKISRNVNIDKECFDLEVEFRTSNENSSESTANFTVTIRQDRCDISPDILSISKVSELGITAVHINMDNRIVSEFWRDKMNSILVFCGCGAIVVIVLVTCLVMTTGCYKRKTVKKEMHTYKPSKQHLYQPYAIDTMTLDHRKYSRKENFQPINETKHQEPTTIERWVNSQLSKGRQQSSAINLNHDGRQFSNTPKKDSPCQDMSTTDSGIVTTAPRRHHTDTEAEAAYVREIQPAAELPKGNSQSVYRRQLLGNAEPVYHEAHYKTCNSIDYIQHDNEAYIHSPSSHDSDSLEESSKL